MIRYIRFSILVILLLLILKISNSQELTITFSDVNKHINTQLPSKTHFDSLLISKTINEHLSKLHSNGYLTATIDSVNLDSTQTRAFGIMGKQYRWARINLNSESKQMINDFGLKITNLESKRINPKQFIKLSSSIIKRFEDSGYPFIRVRLDSIRILDNEIVASLVLNKGSRILIDTLYIKGDARVKHSYLLALLSLKKSEPYSESKIKLSYQKLSQQPFLSIIKPTEIEFLNHKARLYCYLNSKNASNFSGLAGFFTDKLDGKIKLSGDLRLSIINSMRSGEKINLAWNAPGKGTQNLNLETDWPYIAGSQIGILGKFSLYKRDSTFLTTNPKLIFSFFTPNGGRFLLNLDYKKTSISSISQITQLNYSNASALLYGAGYEYNGLSSLILPTRGLYFMVLGKVGNRKLNQSISKKSNLIEGEMAIKGYLPLSGSWLILALGSNSRISEVINSEESSKLYENELYRIGGMGTIRGFNQETILSQAYSISSVEIHLRMGEGSGLYLFADKGIIKTYELGSTKLEWPLGFGLGLNLITKAGIFNINYALGEGFGQTIGLKDAKVHFGIATLF